MNVILRPVFQRPEMLKLSLEYELMAREHFKLCDFITVFLVEYGADSKTLELIKSYPFKCKYIFREKKYGLTVNILEGMKEAFNLADDFVIHLEDDILLHKTYFEYMYKLLEISSNGKFSVLSPYSPDDNGEISDIITHNHYAALAPLISKYFFETYILPCANKKYYNNMAGYVIKLNNLYKEYWDNRKYKYTNASHHEQAGLINRLIDVAIIEEDLNLYMPRINRQQHIGYFGKNRPGGKIPGNSYDERLENLKEIIKDPKLMYDLSATKQYNDYKSFSPELNKWDGSLYLRGYFGTAR